MNKKCNDNNFINFWLSLSEMDILLQRSVTTVFMPCYCLRTKEMASNLEQLSYEIVVCSQYKVFGVSVEERYPALYQDLQMIHESVEQLQIILQSQCQKRFTRLYHSLLNFRSCILFFRWREGWFYPEEMLQTSFSVFSMFNPVICSMHEKDVLSDFEWKGIGRLVQVAWAERELMFRTQNFINDLKKGQIDRIVRQSLYCLNEMEYAVSVKSKNHFQRNYEALMELYNPLHTQTFVKSQEEEMRISLLSLFVIAVSVIGFTEDRRGLWVDLYKAEPVDFNGMIEDLSSVDVVFIGEAHRVDRHHHFQNDIVKALSATGKKVLLGIEMMEAEFQDSLDQYNKGEIDFDGLAIQTKWSENWKNYKDYQDILESVIQANGKVQALNANSDIIRTVGRNGLDELSEEDRETLPAEMNFDDPLYEKWLNQMLLVHMPFSKEMLWKVYQAQVARDEMMAYQMANAWMELKNDDEWIGVVLCGSGHCSYGNGTVSRYLRRLPELKDRIVLMSESGDTVLTEQEKEMARDIEITHEDLRFLQRPIADYLHVIEENPTTKESDEE